VKSNGPNLWVTALDGEETVTVDTFREALQNQARSVQIIRDELNDAREERARLALALDSIQAHMARQDALLITMSAALQQLPRAPGILSPIQVTPAISRSATTTIASKTSPGLQLLDDLQEVEYATNDLLAGLKNLTVKELFIRWYRDQLHARVLEPGDKSTRVLNLCARVVCYMKLFLPEDTTITARPTACDAMEYREWISKISGLGVAAEQAVNAFFESRVEESGRLRKRAHSSFVQATAKRLRETFIAELPSPPLVRDEATSQQFNWTTNHPKMKKRTE
jgi:hypothetical protein